MYTVKVNNSSPFGIGVITCGLLLSIGSGPMASDQPSSESTSSVEEEIDGKPPGIIRRISAFVLDLITIVLIPLSIGLLGNSMLPPQDEIAVVAITFFIFIATVLFYFPVLESIYGYTLGKKILSIEIRDKDASNIGFFKSLLRSLMKYVFMISPPLVIIFLPFRGDPDPGQWIHDSILGTRVVWHDS